MFPMILGIDCRLFSTSFGIGRYTFELVRNLIKLDQVNTYYLFGYQADFKNFKTPVNFHKVITEIPIYSFKEQLSFWRVLRRYPLDLMHFTHFSSPLLYRRPCIATIHDITHTVYPGRKKSHFFHRFSYTLVISSLLKRAKQLIAVSQFTKNDLIRHFQVPSLKIRVIYEGVADEFKPIRQKTLLAKTLKTFKLKPGFLLYTGAHRYHKNLTNLILAFEKLTKTKDFSADLVITGKPDPLYPEPEQLAKTLRLQKRVRFLGAVSEKDLINLYNLASLYVFPSLYEGFGLPLLEAMACGTPVVCSNASSLPEVAGRDAALLFDPTNPQEIAQKILVLYQDPALQKKLIRSGFKRLKQFSWEKMARETLGIYKKYE
ncbi:hypothetical protein COT40_00450 [Candidatus Peregrinibacteria bacterium CG08_land_8_20_14_0_20_41_10]|nr:MAG: hypothetical protein COT40_00450 [Candidatus Peregrinibacteria bacterium CG08_land_8_20_14_0_20_41_10]